MEKIICRPNISFYGGSCMAKYNKKRQGKYGFVEFIDKRKLKDGLNEYDVEPEIRKPTPKEREDIILNFIRAYSGRYVRVWGLAENLECSL